MLRLTRRYQFCASHRLHLDSLSEAENEALFGKCNNPYGHGHNYTLHVTVRGEADPETGLLIGRGELDDALRAEVLPRIDHKDMNTALPELADRNPTTENLAQVIGGWLCRSWGDRFPQGGPKLSRITLEETGRNTFTLEMEALDGLEDR
jgi:6-pyruvoyltetrahydropterin/6-carboxytetrahydropterin synthase